MKTNTEILDLEQEIEVDKSRLEKDEKKLKRVFGIIIFLVLIVVLNFAIIYFFIFKPANISGKEGSNAVTVSATPTRMPTISPTVAQNITPQVIQSNVKEYFVPFGSGSGNSSDWVSVDGLTASIDLGSFENIKEVRFEVSANVPTANQIVWIRLFNKTDGHEVWNSQVNLSGAGGYVVSDPLVFDKGEKQYQVQLKTQLQYPTNITQSRLHIKLN